MSIHTSNAMAGELLSIAARFDLRLIESVNDCYVYAISEKWKIATLTQEPGVATASTLRELEEALMDKSIHSVFVPAFSFGLAPLARVIARHNVSTTIYWEGA